MMLSAKGGMDIEQVAKDNPKDLVKLHISPSEGLDKKDLDKSISISFFDQKGSIH